MAGEGEGKKNCCVPLADLSLLSNIEGGMGMQWTPYGESQRSGNASIINIVFVSPTS